MLTLALPNILNYLLTIVIEVVSNVYIGNLNEAVALAGIGLASYTVNLIGFVVNFGFNSTLEDLLTEAIKEGNKELAMQYRNQAIILVTLLLLPIMTGLDPLYYLLVYLFK